MKNYSTNEVRQLWLDFFNKEKQHLIIESAPLVPKNDDTLLWINSGVAAIKTYFDGSEKPPGVRLVNSQPSIRTNDIENVGKTARHHTLFEMLGSFSIGDYFKKDAICWAWEFLTDPKWLGLDPKKLYITVYQDDDFTYNVWKNEIGIAEDKIIKGDKKTNFWEIGQGPCGPNTEIFYDRGLDYDPENKGIKLLQDDIDNDRYLEVWNLVFSQYNNDGLGNYSDLPMQNIDTGMGLERTVSILQNAATNFETDQFSKIIKDIEQETKIKFISEAVGQNTLSAEDQRTNMAFKAIADHVKCNVFAIADGAIHSNEKRGYVLRRLLRRAVNMARRLDIKTSFLYKLVDQIVEYNQDFFPRLLENKEKIIKLIKMEEEKFMDTIEKGHKKLKSIIEHKKEMSALDAFLLFNSFGFPIELTQEICLEDNIQVDIKEFNKLSQEHKNKAKSSFKSSTSMAIQSEALAKLNVASTFNYHNENITSKVVAIIQDDKIVESATGTMLLAFEETPFYVQSGGQISDQGTIGEFEVEALLKSPTKTVLHQITSDKPVTLQDSFELSIWDQRFNLQAHHSGSHLIHQVVKELFGSDANQAGKFVGNTRLRFDFTCTQKLSFDIASKIEKLVNERINENNIAVVKEMPYQEAVEQGAIALFTEKYADDVRTIKIGGSFELCGGTHVNNSSEIEQFVLTSFESKGAGVYRVEGICTKALCLEYNQEKNNELIQQYNQLKTKYQNHPFFVQYQNLHDSYLDNSKELDKWKEEMVKGNKALQKQLQQDMLQQFKNLKDQVVEINGVKVLAIFAEASPVIARELSAYYTNLVQDLVFVWGSTFEEKSSVMVSVSKSYTNQASAKNILAAINDQTGMKGGGNDFSAQAGSDKVDNLEEVIKNIEGYLNV